MDASEYLRMTVEVNQLEQLHQWPALVKKIVGPTLIVGGFEIVDPHRVVDALGDVRRTDGLVGGKLGVSIGLADNAPALDSTAGHEDAHARGPMIAAGPFD